MANLPKECQLTEYFSFEVCPVATHVRLLWIKWNFEKFNFIFAEKPKCPLRCCRWSVWKSWENRKASFEKGKWNFEYNFYPISKILIIFHFVHLLNKLNAEKGWIDPNRTDLIWNWRKMSETWLLALALKRFQILEHEND